MVFGETHHFRKPPFVTLRRSVKKLLGKHDILGWWWFSDWMMKIDNQRLWYMVYTLKSDCEMRYWNHAKQCQTGQKVAFVRFYRFTNGIWSYSIIHIYIRFSAVKFSKFQTSPTPNKQPQLQTSDRFVPDPAHVPNNPKAAMIRKYPRKLPASGRRNRWHNSTWEDSTLAIFFQRKRLTKHCANPCQPRMSEEHVHEPFKIAHLLQLERIFEWSPGANQHINTSLIGGNLWSPPLNQSQSTHGCRDKICENFNSNILAKPQRIVSLL